jgi:hypothetical protein
MINEDRNSACRTDESLNLLGRQKPLEETGGIEEARLSLFYPISF